MDCDSQCLVQNFSQVLLYNGNVYFSLSDWYLKVRRRKVCMIRYICTGYHVSQSRLLNSIVLTLAAFFPVHNIMKCMCLSLRIRMIIKQDFASTSNKRICLQSRKNGRKSYKRCTVSKRQKRKRMAREIPQRRSKVISAIVSVFIGKFIWWL